MRVRRRDSCGGGGGSRFGVFFVSLERGTKVSAVNVTIEALERENWLVYCKKL